MTLTPRTSKLLAVGMLFGALIWARHERRVLPAAPISLEDVPKKVAQWECVEESIRAAYGVEVKTIARTYRGPGQIKASVIFQATYTRLGALRDWSLARTTDGWTITHEAQHSLTLTDGSENITVRSQKLTKEEATEVGVSWYTSPDRGAASLMGAEVTAWRDRLFGRKEPWLSVYITVPSTGGGNSSSAEAMALELAQHLGTELRAVAAKSSVP